MFEWYRHSKVCYIYLDDVSREEMNDILHFSDRDNLLPDEEELFYQSKFAHSRWFQRGWTLQEIIAPSNVLFFGRDWDFLGSSQRLLGGLVLITGIERYILCADNSLKIQYLQRYSAAQKMSWAASRQTTRIEDEAYCLMGLFGVNMPLLYGEGSAAFIRLQEEIIRTSPDQSIFAWMPKRKEDNNLLLAPSPSCFRHARSVVRYSRDNVEESYSMTNTGLSIRLPLIVKQTFSTRYKFCGVLSCRYADNIRGPMGIDLSYVGKNEQGNPTFLVWDRGLDRSDYKRLPTVSLEDANKAPKTQVFLLRSPHSSLLSSRPLSLLTETPTAFLLPKRFAKWTYFTPYAFHPRRHWKLIEPQGYSLLLPSNIYSAAILWRYKKQSVIMIFGLRKRNWNREAPTVWTTILRAEDIDLRDLVQGGEGGLFIPSLSHRASFQPTPLEHLEMEMVRKAVMGETAFEIHVKVKGFDSGGRYYSQPLWW